MDESDTPNPDQLLAAALARSEGGDAAGLPELAGLLGTIAAAVPLPLLLFDPRGRLHWLSQEAARRLELDEATPASTAAPPALEALRKLACKLADSPILQGLLPPPHAERFVGTGEELFLRRVRPPRGPEDPPWLLVGAWAPVRPAGATPSPEVLQQVGLTAREAEVARLVAQGFTELNVASQLGVSEATAHSHLRHVYQKLGVCSRVDLVRTFELLMRRKKLTPVR